MKIYIEHPVTRIAVGQTVRLSAYQKRRLQDNYDNGKPVQDPLRAPVKARWSESDSSVASINFGGLLTALRPGQVTVKSVWKDYDASVAIEVVEKSPSSPLPKLSAQSTNRCYPQTISLKLDLDRRLHFHLGFDDEACKDLDIDAAAPETLLPWEFEFIGGKVFLTSAHRSTVEGKVHFDKDGDILFTVWSEGEGAYPVSLTGKSIMMVGDSMVEGLGPVLKKKIEAAGGKLYWEPWYSSTTITWQESKRLSEMIEKHRPDIVFIALGSNEIFIPKQEPRAAAVRSLTEEIGDRPAYWIGPPSWKQDQGIVNTIEKNFQTGHFYNSNNLNLPRRRDGAHPTPEGARQWAELVWNWYSQIF